MPEIGISPPFRLCFELHDIAEIKPWNASDGPKQHSFGLTSGRFWIETPLGEILRYTDEVKRKSGCPFRHVDYYVAHFFEDLQESCGESSGL